MDKITNLGDKLKNSKFVDFIKEKGPDIAKTALNVTGTITGNAWIQNTADLIKGSQEIKAEDKERAVELLYQEADMIKLHLADIANAREYNYKLQDSVNSTKLAKIIPSVIDIVVLSTWLGLTFFIAAKYFNLVDTNKTNINMDGIWGLYAAVTGMATTIVGYYRGSSIGSKTKDELINQLKK